MKISINGKPLLKKIENEYQVFELIPSSSTRNYNNSLIAKLAASLYRSPAEREKFFTESAWIEFKDEYKISFKTYITKDKINFYLVVPEDKTQEFKRKIESTYNREVAIAEIEELPRLDPTKCYCAELSLKKHPIFSLDTDSKETSAPLESILSTVKTLEDGDIALLDVLFSPYNVKGWFVEAKKAHNYLEHGIIPGVVSKKNIWQILDDLLEKVRLGILSWVPATKEEKKKINSYLSTNQKRALAIKEEMSNSSRKKQNEEVLETNIRVAVQSEDIERARSAGRTLTAAFKDVSQDNELEAVEVPKTANVKFIYNIENQKKTAKTNKLSIHECGKLLQLPGKSLQQDYPQINANTFKEVDMPVELTQADIKAIDLGTVNQKGLKMPYRIPLESFGEISQNSVDDANCGVTILQGKMGSGKTASGKNICMDYVLAGNSAVIIDTADGEVLHEFVNALPEDYPEEKVVILDLDNRVYPVQLGWNDIFWKVYAQGDEELLALEISERINNKFISFVNELSNTSEMSDRMLQFTNSCLRAVSSRDNWSFLDLELSLISPSYRKELLQLQSVKEMLDVARDLELLQDKAAEHKEGQFIDPILSRLRVISNTQFLSNLFFQEPLNDEKGNPILNIRRALDNPEGGYGYSIIIKCSYDTWQDYQALILGFLNDKIDFSIFSRIDTLQAKRKTCIKWIDEPHKIVKNIERRLAGTSVEFRKYRCKQLFSCHSISQMGLAKDSLLNGGTQVISFKTDNLQEFSRFGHLFKPYDDAVLLYEALPDKYKAVVTSRLPNGKSCPAFLVDMRAPYKPIKDRSYLWMECAKKYGRHWKEVRDNIQQKRQHYQKLDQQLYGQIEAEKEAKKGQRKKASTN